MKNLLIIWSFIAVMVTTALVISISQKQKIAAIDSFEACAAAGYEVMDSYPGQCRTPDGRNFTQNIGNELELVDLIMISNPRPNQKVTSPINLVGQARGLWYFEANFSAEVQDANGKSLGTTVVAAQGEWMTENFVPFNAQMTFETPTSSEGKLILRNANPSGLPENDKQLTIPVKF